MCGAGGELRALLAGGRVQPVNKISFTPLSGQRGTAAVEGILDRFECVRSCKAVLYVNCLTD